jgi:hypothetical protein
MKRGVFQRMTVVSARLRMGQLIEALRLRELEVPGEHQDGQCERERQQSEAAEVAGQPQRVGSAAGRRGHDGHVDFPR